MFVIDMRRRENGLRHDLEQSDLHIATENSQNAERLHVASLDVTLTNALISLRGCADKSSRLRRLVFADSQTGLGFCLSHATKLRFLATNCSMF